MAPIRDIHLMYSEEGDWVGLYLDGKLVYEGHSLPVSRLLAALDLPFTEEERDLSEEGRCPKTVEAASLPPLIAHSRSEARRLTHQLGRPVVGPGR